MSGLMLCLLDLFIMVVILFCPMIGVMDETTLAMRDYV